MVLSTGDQVDGALEPRTRLEADWGEGVVVVPKGEADLLQEQEEQD